MLLSTAQGFTAQTSMLALNAAAEAARAGEQAVMMQMPLFANGKHWGGVFLGPAPKVFGVEAM